MDRDGLADFLRRRRASVSPGDVGLPEGRRRRTAGLRREEVAALAYVSTDFYTRMEQARGSRPSPETVAALAGALRLTPAESDHLHRLAGHVPPPRTQRADRASEGLQRVLASLDAPAHVVSDLGVTLAQNPLSRALLGDHSRHHGLAASVYHRWFTDPAERERWTTEDHDRHSRSYVASLRMAHGRTSGDPAAQALVDALHARSPEFARLWAQHEVGPRTDTTKRVEHPLVGRLTLDCQVLTSPDGLESLVVFTPAPGSDDAERLQLLAVLGTQEFATGDA